MQNLLFQHCVIKVYCVLDCRATRPLHKKKTKYNKLKKVKKKEKREKKKKKTFEFAPLLINYVRKPPEQRNVSKN